MRYISTRGGGQAVEAGQAILRGPAEDGGLYVPEYIPAIGQPLADLAELSYRALAYAVLRPFLSDFTENELRACIDAAYGDNFDDPRIAPLREAGGHYFLELFHGRTLAFKDMALSVLPHLLKTADLKYDGHKKIIILTATSGDTGKAALDAFAGAPGIAIAVFYPENGVSAMQKRQMVTQAGDNVFVYGVRGNFDDAQTGVKQIFSDPALAQRMAEAGLVFSSANSINIGRLLPQVVYYFYAYFQMVRQGAIRLGDPLHVAVPTGNFGNILAGYYAKRMGLPIDRLICASNENNVLFHFFKTGVYDKKRPFMVTMSPSMDILISSNLERLLYTAQSPEQVRQCMENLASQGFYQVTADWPDFYGVYATEAETGEAIRAVAKNGYIIDPHTAVAYHAGRRFVAETGDTTPQLIVSTASPYKFAEDVCAAVKGSELPLASKAENEFAYVYRLQAISGTPIPAALAALAQKAERHTAVCAVSEMQAQLERDVLFPEG